MGSLFKIIRGIFENSHEEVLHLQESFSKITQARVLCDWHVWQKTGIDCGAQSKYNLWTLWPIVVTCFGTLRSTDSQ